MSIVDIIHLILVNAYMYASSVRQDLPSIMGNAELACSAVVGKKANARLITN